MAQAFIGEIRIFAGNFAPAGWAFCNGQLVAIAENDTLFQLIGTTYGGDGQTTFALPDLRSRVPIHMGQGSGLQSYVIGQSGGVETVTLTQNQMPGHTHAAACNGTAGTGNGPGSNVWANNPANAAYIAPASIDGLMNAQAIGLTGGNQAHDNMLPYLAISYIISLFGVFPSPN
jgi:microcystin-dependent protein